MSQKTTTSYIIPVLATLVVAAAITSISTGFMESDGLEIPNTFAANTPAIANEVNENFQALAGALDANSTRLTTVEESFADVGVLKNVRVVAGEGAAFTSVAAAMESITDATASNRYVVRVAAGVFEESSPILVKEFVELVGSGTAATRIRRSASDSSQSSEAAVITLANNSVVRDLSVHNDGNASTYALGMYGATLDESSRVEDVEILVDGIGGSLNYGIWTSDADLVLQRSVITVRGASAVNAAYGSTDAGGPFAQPLIEDCRLFGEGSNTGIAVELASTAADIRGCELNGWDRAVLTTVGGITFIRDSRLQTLGQPVMEVVGSPVLLCASTFLVGSNPVGDSSRFKYVHCIKANHDPVDNGIGSDIEP